MEVKTKICTKCCLEKDVCFFSFFKKKNRHDSRCRTCRNIAGRAYRLLPGRKEKNKESWKRYWFRTQNRVVDLLGGECLWCKESNPIFLTIDHINNDGQLHRLKGANRVYLDIIADNNRKEKYRILCYSCNCARQRVSDQEIMNAIKGRK